MKHDITDVFGNGHELDLDNLVVTSDLHIGHRPNPKTGVGGILQYGRGDRWMTIDAMNDALLDSLYKVLAETSGQLLLIGDAAMGQREENLPMIKDALDHAGATAFLVPGNHDHCHPMHKKHVEWQEKYRDLGGLIPLPVQLEIPTHIGDVTVCHFPFASIGDHTEEMRYASWRPEDRGQFLLHGHLHGTKGKLTSPHSVDVGVDAWGYEPVMFADVLNFLKENS